MKQLALATVLVTLASSAFAADPVDGVWKTEPDKTGAYLNVSIGACGSKICGTIKSAFDASGSEDKSYASLGKKMIWDMVPEGGGTYDKGQIWDPDRNENFGSKMTLDGSDKLNVKGCAAGGLLCQTQTWTRVQ